MNAVCIIAGAGLLAVNAVTDVRKREILPVFSVLLGVTGILWRLFWLVHSPASVFAGMLPGAMFLLLAAISRGGIGAGDGIVVAALGCWLPLGDCLICVVISLVCLFIGAAILFMIGRRKKKVPYIPFLLLGYGASLLL